MRVDIVCCTSMLCNLRCRYCDVYPMLANPARMSLEQIDRLFVNVDAHFRELGQVTQINFHWYGGEPLLIAPDIYRKIFAVQRRVFNGAHHIVTNSVQSNFTVIDEDRIDLLRDHFDVVGVSLDLFSQLRVSAGGICQEYRALHNLDRVCASGINVCGVTVLNRFNLFRVPEIYEFYRHRRMNFRMLPLERGLYAPGQDFEVTPSEILTALCGLADLWLSDNNPVQVEPIARYVFLVRHMLRDSMNRVGMYDREVWMPVLMVNTDGTVRGYGDRFQEESGNIFDTSLKEILAGPRFLAGAQTARLRMQRTCTQCPYYGRACPGDAIAESQQDFVELDEAGSIRCVVARGLIAYLEERLQQDPAWSNNSIGERMLATYSCG